MEPPPWW